MSRRAEDLLTRMVEIPSVSGNEDELARFLVDEMREWGFETYLDEAGNAIGRRGDPDAPMILLTGHMDTVPGGPAPRRDGDLLYGRGAVDAKGPLAAMICAAAEASVDGVQYVVAGVVEEETYGKGATHLAECFRPAVGFVGEPNGWAGVGIGYKGRVMLRYDVSRPSVHTASPEEKASEAAVAFWQDVVAYCASVTTSEKAFDRPIATLNEMTGDIESARLVISVRTPPGFDLPAFEEYLGGVTRDGVLKIDDRTPGVRVDHRGSAVRALCAGIRARGARPTLKLKTGTADLNIVEPVWGVPMAVYGPGDSALDHTDDEHISFTEYAAAIDVLRDALNHVAVELRQ
ncbi:MAG: M20/M25/M40 family metallo-hydrolase [Actinomycetota bacterium]|nr:M20/M25/M40 family metallo-hydrolase [Actinomycetota bacterium]